MSKIFCGSRRWIYYDGSARPADVQSVEMRRRRHKAASAALLRFAREVVDQRRLDETFTDVLDSPPTERSLGGEIVHLATHSMHHRAQLLFMLRRLSVEGLIEEDALSWEETLTAGPKRQDGE